MGTPLKVYWWNPVPNYGDQLTPLLMQRVARVRHEWAPIGESELIVVGSVLDALPTHGYQGTILGAGKIRDSQLDLSQANVLALRGPITYEGSGAKPCLFADPGLLAPTMVTLPTRGTRDLVVIPYVGESLPYRGTPIDLRDPPLRIIKVVAKHRRLVSSSLHALILADALGIPRMWHPGKDVAFNELKFRDYAASMDLPAEPNVWVEAPQDKVRFRQEELTKLFESL